jgi:serine/threonine protein kinase
MGKVYKAYDETLERNVAIKVIKDDLSHNEVFKKRFLFEAKTIAKLNHPNIVRIYQCNDEDEQLYLVMEYIDGIVLSNYPFVKTSGFATHLNIFRQVLKGLKCAHDAGIIHRDIKTPNIMIGSDGLARLLDFGIARSEIEDQEFTMTGDLLGTVSYMSPEVTIGEKASIHSDLYSMGIVLYEIITGQVPFKSSTPLNTLHQIKTEPIPDIRSLTSGISPRLYFFIEKLCHKKNYKRFQNCAEALTELDIIIAEESFPHKKVSPQFNYEPQPRATRSDDSTKVGHGNTTINSIAEEMGISPRRAKAALERERKKRDNEYREEPKPKKKSNVGCIVFSCAGIFFLTLFFFAFVAYFFVSQPIAVEPSEQTPFITPKYPSLDRISVIKGLPDKKTHPNTVFKLTHDLIDATGIHTIKVHGRITKSYTHKFDNQPTLYFNGNSWITFKNKLHLSNKDFTIQGWVFPEGLPRSSFIFTSRTGASNADTGFTFSYGKDFKWAIQAYSGIDFYGSHYPEPDQVVFNQWNHFALVRKGHQMIAYLNGKVMHKGLAKSKIGNRIINHVGGEIYIGTDEHHEKHNGGVERLKGYLHGLEVIVGKAIAPSNIKSNPQKK